MTTIYEIAKRTNQIAHEKKIWEDGINIPRNIALIHSEVSEALEADRIDDFAKLDEFYSKLKLAKKEGKGNFISEDEIFKQVFENTIKNTFEDEMADILLRTLDLCFEMKIDIVRHLELKMEYNSLRPIKNGKKY